MKLCIKEIFDQRLDFNQIYSKKTRIQQISQIVFFFKMKLSKIIVKAQ